MSEHEQQIIKDAINLNGRGGIKTFIEIDGTFISNYVPYRRYFKDIPWTEEHKNYAIKHWKIKNSDKVLDETALNTASWIFYEQWQLLPENDRLDIFNSMKKLLRPTIQKYLDSI